MFISYFATETSIGLGYESKPVALILTMDELVNWKEDYRWYYVATLRQKKYFELKRYNLLLMNTICKGDMKGKICSKGRWSEHRHGSRITSYFKLADN